MGLLVDRASALQAHWRTVLRVMVHPQHQGNGAGRVLMESLRGSAVDLGLEQLQLTIPRRPRPREVLRAPRLPGRRPPPTRGPRRRGRLPRRDHARPGPVALALTSAVRGTSCRPPVADPPDFVHRVRTEPLGDDASTVHKVGRRPPSGAYESAATAPYLGQDKAAVRRPGRAAVRRACGGRGRRRTAAAVSGVRRRGLRADVRAWDRLSGPGTGRGVFKGPTWCSRANPSDDGAAGRATPDAVRISGRVLCSPPASEERRHQSWGYPALRSVPWV
ncbi:hypothetical protein OG558_00090 [Kribbella sp. NBC_01510]|uniref:hypothetical protein n=1 Tax=Kribbella sp. NBC_01510 TaxID=2903581 RepID=UPI00386FC313